MLRTPSFALPSLLFPCLFYVLFGVLLNTSDGDAARYLLATYGVFGVMGVGLFAFGVTVAMEREQGFLIYKRALPMPPGAYLFAKMAMAMLFAVIISLLLATLAAVGLYVGTLVGGQGAPAVVNLLYLPIAFLSRLWLPLKLLPAWIAKLAPVWPFYHHSQIALKVIGMDAGGSVAVHLGVLVGITMVFFLLARRRLAA